MDNQIIDILEEIIDLIELAVPSMTITESRQARNKIASLRRSLDEERIGNSMTEER